jgi:hypothetical protein
MGIIVAMGDFFASLKNEEKVKTIFNPAKEKISGDNNPGYLSGVVMGVDSSMPGHVVRYIVGYDADTSQKVAGFSGVPLSIGTKVSIKKYWYVSDFPTVWENDIIVFTKQ